MTRRAALQIVACWLGFGSLPQAQTIARIDFGAATRLVIVSGNREVTVSVDELLDALR